MEVMALHLEVKYRLESMVSFPVDFILHVTGAKPFASGFNNAFFLSASGILK